MQNQNPPQTDKDAKPQAIFRCDYQASDWCIDRTFLHVQLDATATRVTSELHLRWQPQDGSEPRQLRLDGVGLQLEAIAVDSRPLPVEHYQLKTDSLLISDLKQTCVLTITTLINPQANTALEGLYLSGGNFCTQCEAEGFRKITYYLDRPDVLSVFQVTIDADQERYPVLLSNGNLLEKGVLDDGRHRVVWHDPFPKPSYLFALVAGNLSVVEDHFVTRSGRKVLLQIYVEPQNRTRCDFALRSLKAAMRWDEDTYGLEYDLDRFMIVAVDDFNMGAMENKGLNIFNSRYVLADKDTATDSDYMGIEAVIAHEYFHNWTGNRITCRDWFQLSLKEGLTVYRDQCFTGDRHSATVKRIEDVRLLRDRQFPEDAGPMAHPIRPDSYIEINNFYTLTVYEKGAEVIRMLHTLVGDAAWQAGMRLYIETHDGSATTCDAFVDAIQACTDQDLTQFRLWYSTAGTPVLKVAESYDAQTKLYRITVQQQVPATPGQTDKAPMHIPLVMGLLDSQGQTIVVDSYRTHNKLPHGSFIVDIRQREQTLEFENLQASPTASLLRGFSAPVRLEHDIDNEKLAFMARYDPDGFIRWDAMQRLCGRLIHDAYATGNISDKAALTLLVEALGDILTDVSLEPAFVAEVLLFPTLSTLAEGLQQVNYPQLDKARVRLLCAVAQAHQGLLIQAVEQGRGARGKATVSDPLSPVAIGLRKRAAVALSMLAKAPDSGWQELALLQFEQAGNLTERLSALSCLTSTEGPERERVLSEFYDVAKAHRLLVDKWFSVQGASDHSEVFFHVLGLLEHPDYERSNPNRVRALIGSFTNNLAAFHDDQGRGYELLRDEVLLLDRTNPQLAARLVQPLTRWQIVNTTNSEKMKAALRLIYGTENLSRDVYELVSKSL